MGGRAIRDLMRSAHPDWNGERPARLQPNTLRYTLTNGDTVYQLHDTVIVRTTPNKHVVWLNMGRWNTLTTRNRIRRILFALLPDDAYSFQDIMTYKGTPYYYLHTDWKHTCIFEFHDGMQLNLYKGVYIPNTPEVRRYCGIASKYRCRPWELLR